MTQKSKLVWLLVILAVMGGLVGWFKLSPSGAQVLWQWSQGGKWLLPLVVIAAMIDSINPCAFSILFLTIAFLISLGKQTREVVKIGGIYILGIFTVYILIGLGILQTLHLFNTPNFMGKIGAVILVSWGSINLINQFWPAFPIKLKIPAFSHKKMAELMHRASIPAAFGLGVLVGLCEFPCTGGPYLMVLGLLHDSATYVRGLGYLFLYNVIFVSPLVLILALAANPELTDKVKAWRAANMNRAQLIGSLVMIGAGLLILSI